MKWVIALFVLSSRTVAQAPVPESVHPEARVDVIASSGRTSIQAGGGVQIPAGYYARVGVLGSVGADVISGGHQQSARVDVVGRFLLDPFRQVNWGISVGAGVSFRAREGDRVRPLLLAVVDVEGKRSTSGISPALQLGLGGGVRAGGALRWGSGSAR